MYRNTPQDEYSESSNYFVNVPKPDQGSNSDRNHYYARTDSSSEIFESNIAKAFNKNFERGRNSKPQSVRLGEKTLFKTDESSILPVREDKTLSNDDEVQIIGKMRLTSSFYPSL